MELNRGTQTDAGPLHEAGSKMTFSDLSKELKELIMERVTRPLDLKRVCLVSKEWHGIAVRSLYRNVALDLGSSNDSHLCALLNPRNVGLRHIRQLRLYCVRDCCDERVHFATRMILEFLPEDVLDEFRWCQWQPFSAENLLLLYKKQRKMKRLEVTDLDRNTLHELKKNKRDSSSIFQNATKLALFPENRSTLNLSAYFVEKTAEHLEELIVHCHVANFESNDAITARDLNDTATAPGLITGTIFRSMLPFDRCTPFRNLRTVSLDRINLRHCVDTWCKFINFHDVQKIRISRCFAADAFFGQLCKAVSLPKNLKTLEFQHTDNAENEAIIALDGFLCLVSGLQLLVIDIDGVKSLPAAASIVRHSKTLRILNVHCAPGGSYLAGSLTSPDIDSNELVWSLFDFEKICTSCKGLEQLSCAWPSTNPIRSYGEDWKSFEQSMRTLRGLVTLHITTWPRTIDSAPLPRAVYETLIQALALRLFELTAESESSISSDDGTSFQPPPHPDAELDDEEDSDDDTDTETNDNTISGPPPPHRLRLIAFGVSNKIHDRQDSRQQLLYVRSTSLTAEGLQQLHAAPVGWCLRQFLEPRSEVLDFELHRCGGREARMPCRENVGLGGWGDEDDDEP